MTEVKEIVGKHLRLNADKLKRARKVLGAHTDSEAIEMALDAVIAEHENNCAAQAANERFVKSGIEIKDVYGVMDE